MAKLQERERALTAALQASLDKNKFEEFLTRVFRKKIKRVKKKERTGVEGEIKCTELCEVRLGGATRAPLRSCVLH